MITFYNSEPYQMGKSFVILAHLKTELLRFTIPTLLFYSIWEFSKVSNLFINAGMLPPFHI